MMLTDGETEYKALLHFLVYSYIINSPQEKDSPLKMAQKNLFKVEEMLKSFFQDWKKDSKDKRNKKKPHIREGASNWMDKSQADSDQQDSIKRYIV